MDLIQVTDVFGEGVTLSDGRWQGHILAAHPEMQPYLAQIEEAIRNPTCVYSSENDPNSRLFYRRGAALGKYKNLYLKVVVSYSSLPATVRTAFFTTSLTGGDLLWIRRP